jgi:hypothetical protein
VDSGTSNWPLKIGQKLKRRQLHALVGGAFQWGITSCMQRSAMLVFNNPKKAREFGYDRWEGWQPNGEFHYTGQGPIGDQDIATRSNNSLLRSKARGIPVHLFRSEGTEVTYLGLFELGENPYRWERAPDQLGNNRKVVVFHLVQVEIDHARD